MKVTCIHDATMRLILTPQTPLESLQLKEMADRSQRGLKTSLVAVDSEAASQFILEIA